MTVVPADGPNRAVPTSPHPQTIRRLTPLCDVAAHLDCLLKPVAAETLAVEKARGLVLAENVLCGADLPPHPVAARDGYAVAAFDLVGASPYSPAYLPAPPPRIDIGTALPPATDTVIGEESVSEHAGMTEISEAAAPGEHVRQRADEAARGDVIATAGDIVEGLLLGAVLAAGIREISIRRPRVLVRTRDDVDDRRRAMLAGLITDAGGVLVAEAPADLEIRIGGTGTGSGDRAVSELGDAVLVHGVAIAPGASAAIARGVPPVLLLPGSLDAMLGAWLAIARPAIDRLTGRTAAPLHALVFAEKTTSSIGVSDFFLARADGDRFVQYPLAGASLPEIAAARFWFAVEAGSEGFRAGQSVQAGAFAHK